MNYAEREVDLRVKYDDPGDRDKRSMLELKVRLRARDGEIVRLRTGARSKDAS